MSIRNLERLFKPKSIAIIGASPNTNSIGGILTRNLLRGEYAGKVMLVNPKHKQIYETPVCPEISLLPESPDLAIVCTPAGTVPSIITDLTRKGKGGH
jgi:acetyltransferase